MIHAGEEQISAYLDGQLDRDEVCALEMHLSECESCRSILQELGELTRIFRDAERHEPSPFIWNRIAARFDEGQSPRHGWRDTLLSGLRRFGWSPGMAAAAMGILLFAGAAVMREIRTNVADRAVLAEIDRAYRSLAVQDPDIYNPFSSGAPVDPDANPFRNIRLGAKANAVSQR